MSSYHDGKEFEFLIQSPLQEWKFNFKRMLRIIVDSRQANTADFTKFHVHAPQDILVNQDAAQRGLVSLVRSRQEGSRMVSVQGEKITTKSHPFPGLV